MIKDFEKKINEQFEKKNLTVNSSLLIIFNPEYSSIAEEVYNYINVVDKFLLSTKLKKNIICSYKNYGNYDFYIIIGVECPKHPFENRICYSFEKEIYIKEKMFISDSLHNVISSNEIDNDIPVIITENQNFFNYYALIHESTGVKSYYINNNITPFDVVSYLMKESINSTRLESNSIFSVIFTSEKYDELATDIVKVLGDKSCYKLFLKDVCYERLTSIDISEDVILIDCPLFSYEDLSFITPYSVKVYITKEWGILPYNRNSSLKNILRNDDVSESVISTDANENNSIQLLEKMSPALHKAFNEKSFKGIKYKNDERDMEIHEGDSGIAGAYAMEGKNKNK